MMPGEKDNNPGQIDQVRGDRSIARPFRFIARRAIELAQKAKDLKLTDDIEVIFTDKQLETVVRDALGKPQGSITRGALKGLCKLRARRVFINVSSIEHVTNLTTLVLHGISNKRRIGNTNQPPPARQEADESCAR